MTWLHCFLWRFNEGQHYSSYTEPSPQRQKTKKQICQQINIPGKNSCLNITYSKKLKTLKGNNSCILGENLMIKQEQLMTGYHNPHFSVHPDVAGHLNFNGVAHICIRPSQILFRFSSPSAPMKYKQIRKNDVVFFQKNLQSRFFYLLTVHQTRIYHISRWFRCRHPVSRPVTVVSWWRPPWIPGKSTRQSAWRRTWRNYWFSGDGIFYCDTVSVRVRARNTVSVRVRARNLWLIVYAW